MPRPSLALFVLIHVCIYYNTSSILCTIFNNRSVRRWLDAVEHAVAPASITDSSLANGQALENVDSGSIASSTSSARSIAQDSVTTLADLQTAEWPTYIHNLDGKEAEAAEGVLSRYTRLMKISQGIGVIAYHLKVGLPIDDSKLPIRLVVVLRRTSSKRSSMLQTGHRKWLTHRLKIGWTRSNKHIGRLGAIEQTISA